MSVDTLTYRVLFFSGGVGVGGLGHRGTHWSKTQSNTIWSAVTGER